MLGVDDNPAGDGGQDEDDPEHAHGPVVAEDHVVHDGRVADGEDAPADETGHAEEPRDHLQLFFLRVIQQNIDLP